MGLFDFLKKKKEKPEMKVPMPPGKEKIPSAPKADKEGKKAPKHIDDLGIPSASELEIPELEMPEFPTKPEGEMPEEAMPEGKEKAPEEEVKKAVEEASEEIPEELPELEEKEEMPKETPKLEAVEEPVELKEIPKLKGPLFVVSSTFKDVKKNIEGIKDNLKNSEDIYNRVNDVKNREDTDFERMHSSFEAIQRKLIFIDKMLFESNVEK